MIDIAEIFVADWIEDHVRKVRPPHDDMELIERLVLKLENDAWEFGLNRKEYIKAVKGDSHRLVSSEVEKASGQDVLAWA